MPKYSITYYATAKSGSQHWGRAGVVLDQPITGVPDLEFAEKLLCEGGGEKQLLIVNWQRFEEPPEPEITFHHRSVNSSPSLYISRKGSHGVAVPMSPADAEALADFFGQTLIHS